MEISAEKTLPVRGVAVGSASETRSADVVSDGSHARPGSIGGRTSRLPELCARRLRLPHPRREDRREIPHPPLRPHPALREELEVLVPADRHPSRAWKQGPALAVVPTPRTERALTAEADIAEAEHQVAARTGTAAAQATAATAQAQAEAEAARTRAELQKTAAERQARAEADALESAEAAAARRDAAHAQEQAAEAELRTARLREEAARTTVEAEHREQEAERTATQRADRRRQQAQAEHQAAETELRTAQLREQAARIEATAQEREDYARLTPRERSERRVARLLLAATPAGQDTQLDAAPLATIQEELSVGRTTASELRTAALGLIQGGYRP